MTNQNRFILVIVLFLAVVVSALLFFQQQDTRRTPLAVALQISYMDILNNPEFNQGIQQAVKTGDTELFNRLQLKAVEIAMAAGLPEGELAMLEGERGEQFIRFRAKRQLFLHEAERRLAQLAYIDDLKVAYPQAQDLFGGVDALFEKRDAQIEQIARELANNSEGQLSLAQARREAERQWLAAQQPSEVNSQSN